MLWRIAIYVVCLAFVVHRVRLALRISRARRAGDTALVARLSRRGAGLRGWAIVAVVVAAAFLTLVFWSTSH